MSADSDNLRNTLVDQLSSFEDKLENKADDVQMLAEIQDGIVSAVRSKKGGDVSTA